MPVVSAEPPADAAPAVVRDDRSLKCYLRHVRAYAIMYGTGEGVFGLFAAFLGLPRHQFGRLAGLPNLLGPFVQIASATAVERNRRRKPLILAGTLFQTLSFVPLIILALWTPANETLRYGVFMTAVLVYYAAAHFVNPAMGSLGGDLVPTDERSSFFAKLQRTNGLFMLLTMVGVSILLYEGEQVHWIGVAYALLFASAFAARSISSRNIRQMREPELRTDETTAFTFWQFLRRGPRSNFFRFVLFVGLFNMGVNVAGPFFLPYFRYDLKYADWQWTLMSCSSQISAILMLFFWERFSKRFGNKATLFYSSLFVSLIPFVWMTTENYWILLPAMMFNGAVWSGANLSIWNYMLEAVTPSKRSRCMAYFHLILGLSIFAGAELGGWMTRSLPARLELGPVTLAPPHAFYFLLFVSGVWRFTTALAFRPLFRELRGIAHGVDPLSVPVRRPSI